MPILRRRNRRPSSLEFSKRVGVGVSRAKLPPAKGTQTISRWLEVEGKLTGVANLQIDGTVRGRVTQCEVAVLQGCGLRRRG